MAVDIMVSKLKQKDVREEFFRAVRDNADHPPVALEEQPYGEGRPFHFIGSYHDERHGAPRHVLFVLATYVQPEDATT